MALKARRRRNTTSALDRLAELRQAADAEREAKRAIDLDRRTATARRDEAREALVKVLSEGSEGSDERRALEEAETRVNARWSEQLEAADRRIREADRAVARFVQDSFGAIASEKRELDAAAHTRLLAAAQELQEAIRAAEVEAGSWAPLLTLRDGGPPSAPNMASMQLDALAQEARRALSRGIPSPTPGHLQEGSKDPTIKAVA